MSTLHSLCEKWSGKGLYECRRRQVGSEVTFVVTVGKDRTLVDPRGKHAGAYILAAVIEAVEASGRIFALDGGLDMPDRYVANVTRKGCGWLGGTNAGANTPAAALLTAYLAALEAEADQ